MHLIPPAPWYENICTKLSTKEAHYRLKQTFMLGDDHLVTLTQYPRLSEGKQMFSINNAVCTNSSRTVSHSYQGPY